MPEIHSAIDNAGFVAVRLAVEICFCKDSSASRDSVTSESEVGRIPDNTFKIEYKKAGNDARGE
jgi:hypothetical protein